MTYSQDYVQEVLTKLNIDPEVIRYTDPVFLEKLCPFSVELHGGVTTCLIAHYLARMLLDEVTRLGHKYMVDVLKTKLMLIPPVPDGFPEFRIEDLKVRCRLVTWLENHYFFECFDEARQLKFYFALRMLMYGTAPLSSAAYSISAALLIAKARLSQTL